MFSYLHRMFTRKKYDRTTGLNTSAGLCTLEVVVTVKRIEKMLLIWRARKENWVHTGVRTGCMINSCQGTDAWVRSDITTTPSLTSLRWRWVTVALMVQILLWIFARLTRFLVCPAVSLGRQIHERTDYRFSIIEERCANDGDLTEITRLCQEHKLYTFHMISEFLSAFG